MASSLCALTPCGNAAQHVSAYVRSSYFHSNDKRDLWDAQLVELVGRHIDDIERGPGLLEQAALRDAQPEEIPVWRRILGIDVLFSSAGRDAVITFFVQKCQVDDTVIAVRKTLTW